MTKQADYEKPFVGFRIEPELLAHIDTYANRVDRNRSNAIVQLIKRGLEEVAEPEPKGKK